jgi:hypothetical protein
VSGFKKLVLCYQLFVRLRDIGHLRKVAARASCELYFRLRNGTTMSADRARVRNALLSGLRSITKRPLLRVGVLF